MFAPVSLIIHNLLYYNDFFNTDDRFVAAGTRLLVSLQPDSANHWLYYNDMGLTAEQAKELSDHYPIEFKFYSNWFYPLWSENNGKMHK